MLWTVPCFFFFAGFFIDCVCAGEQCREVRSINGMALQGFVFKTFSVRAFHECDISCERELTCQSYNYVVGENSCELSNRTREARPEHFRSDLARVYLRRLSNRGMYDIFRKPWTPIRSPMLSLKPTTDRLFGCENASFQTYKWRVVVAVLGSKTFSVLVMSDISLPPPPPPSLPPAR